MVVVGLGVEAGADAHAMDTCRISESKIPSDTLNSPAPTRRFDHRRTSQLQACSARQPRIPLRTSALTAMCTAAVAPMQAAATLQRPWDDGSVRGVSAASSALFDLDMEVCCSLLTNAGLPSWCKRTKDSSDAKYV